jgi:hypothetical protein
MEMNLAHVSEARTFLGEPMNASAAPLKSRLISYPGCGLFFVVCCSLWLTGCVRTPVYQLYPGVTRPDAEVGILRVDALQSPQPLLWRVDEKALSFSQYNFSIEVHLPPGTHMVEFGAQQGGGYDQMNAKFPLTISFDVAAGKTYKIYPEFYQARPDEPMDFLRFSHPDKWRWRAKLVEVETGKEFLPIKESTTAPPSN